MKEEVCKWCNGELPDKNWCMDCNGKEVEKLIDRIKINSRRNSIGESYASYLTQLMNRQMFDKK